MFKTEYIAFQWIYIHICFICLNNAAYHTQIGQQLLGLTLRVNPWLWNWGPGGFNSSQFLKKKTTTYFQRCLIQYL